MIIRSAHLTNCSNERGHQYLFRMFSNKAFAAERKERRPLKSSIGLATRLHINGDLDDQKGVQELYRHAVANLERSFQKHTTRSSIGFTAMLDGSRKTFLSLIPQESDATDGLRFQVYSRRLRTWLHLSEDDDLAMLPVRRDPWIYYETAGPDYEGYQGFFASRAEIDSFIDGLRRPQEAGIS